MFAGFVILDASMHLAFLVRTSASVPVDLDALPSYRVYGADGLMANGTGTAVKLDATGLYKVVIAALAADGYEAGKTYAVLLQGALSGGAWGELFSFSVG